MSRSQQIPDDDSVPPARLRSLFLIAELVQNYEWTVEELKSAGLEERDFRQKLAILRLMILNEGFVEVA